MKPVHFLAIGLVVLGTYVLVSGTSEATHSIKGITNSLSGSCTNWSTTPRVNLNWSLHDRTDVNSIEKQDLSAVRGFGTSWGFISCDGNSNCWGQAGVGRNQTSYTDTNINAGTTYTYRIKHDADHASNNYVVTIDSCSCGGGCPPVDDSRFLSKTPGSTNVATGNQFSVTYSVQNTGTSTWVDPPYTISATAGIPAQLTVNNITMTESIPGGGITPNETIWLTVTMTPTTAGSYTIPAWRVTKSGAAFGDTMPAHAVTVNALPRGAIDSIDCSAGLKGWTLDDDQPATSLTYVVQRIQGNLWSGPFLADELHPPQGNHGYTWAIPQTYKDGNKYRYRIYARDANSPTIWQQVGTREITCYVPPNITFNAVPNAISYNGATTLSWSVEYPNGVTCNATNGGAGWPGSKAVSGSEVSDTLLQDTTFTLTCTNPAGSTVAQAAVAVADPPQPAVTVTGHQFCTTGIGGTITWNYESFVLPALPQTEYRVQISNNDTFTSIAHDTGRQPFLGGNPGTVTMSQSITPGQTYYVRAKAWDDRPAGTGSNESAWSSPATYSFSHPPRPGITLNPLEPRARQPFNAIDASDYGGAAVTDRQWDMGDGTTYGAPPSPGPANPQHTYAEPGSVTISLVITDSNGQTCSTNIGAEIREPLPGFKEVLPE